MVPRPDVSKASGSPDVCLACHSDKPALCRATLLERWGEALARNKPSLVADILRSEHAVIRESAYRVLRHGAEDQALNLTAAGLNDPALAVRIAAFETLVRLGQTLDSGAWENARNEYEHFLDIQSDLPSGLVLRTRYLLANDMVDKAEKTLDRALEKDRGFVPAAIRLTNVLRSGGSNREAIQLIDSTLEASPGEA